LVLPDVGWTQRNDFFGSSVGQRTVQTPLTQLSPLAQALPQLPQFAVSVWKSRQAPLQQVVPLAQTSPHEAQLVLVPRVVQVPLQQVWPPLQVGQHCPLAMQVPLQSK
jgi:hypothetical protein